MARAGSPSDIVVLKFGSSVLCSAARVPEVAQYIYRHTRGGRRVVAVVSAFAGTTDSLFAEAHARGLDREATAEHVARGEALSARALVTGLEQCGVPALACHPAAVGLRATGPVLDAMPEAVNVGDLRSAIERHPVTVLPGYCACDSEGRTVLLGRGGSDLTAVWIADQLGAGCTLVKDVDGLYQRDPALPGPRPARLSRATWRTAVAVGGRLLQKKAVEYAHVRQLEFAVTSLTADSATLVGPGPDVFETPAATPPHPLRVALLGCGTVGRGVLERVQSLQPRFQVVGVLVRDVDRYRRAGTPDIAYVTAGDTLLAQRPDVVIELIGGTGAAANLIDRALAQGARVITANKSLIARCFDRYAPYLTGSDPQLRCSAAVGGAVPMLEFCSATSRRTRVVGLRAVINGTTNFVLDRLATGDSLHDAVRAAQQLGLAEADPGADLSGADAASKLSLLARMALGIDLDTASIRVTGIASIDAHRVATERRARRRVRLVAALDASQATADAWVRPLVLDASDYLAGAQGAENRLEIHTADGKVHRCSGAGAGRWPTTTAVMADLLDTEAFLRTRWAAAAEHAQAREA